MSSIKFTPLLGARDESEPQCYLLSFHGFTFLLDCGWTVEFELEQIEPIVKVAHDVDAVLISHCDIEHLGALPYLVGQKLLTCPIFVTIPVYKLGQMFLYDAYQSLSAICNFKTWNLDDVDLAFERMVPLRFHQRKRLERGIQIRPSPAGHTVGGSIWSISRDMEEIMYAVDYNHQHERHLNGISLQALSGRSMINVLITDTMNATAESSVSRNVREKRIWKKILKTLRGGGDVLIPCDAAARVLELLIFLENFWVGKRIGNYGLVFLSHTAFSTVEFAKAQLEWMSGTIVELFDSNRENPFAFKFFRLCNSISQLEAAPSPRVVLCGVPNLEYGFAQELFLSMAENPKNRILFTFPPRKGTPAAQLFDLRQGPPSSHVFRSTVRKKVALEGQEYRDWKAAEKGKVSVPIVESPTKDDLNNGTGPSSGAEGSESTVERLVYVADDADEEFDEYGETVNLFSFDAVGASEGKKPTIVGASGSQGRMHGAEILRSSEPEEQAASDALYDEKLEEEEAPTKAILEDVEVTVQCKISFVDASGRSDGRSMKTILAGLAPHNVVLVHGSPESDRIIGSFLEESVCNEIFLPMPGESVEMDAGVSAYRVELEDSLFNSLVFEKVGEYEVCNLRAVVAQVEPDQRVVLAEGGQSAVNESEDDDPALVGDVRMSELKGVMSKLGFSVDLFGGTLICNRSVSIKKISDPISGSHKIMLEGPATDEYYRIRNVLYDQLHQL